MEAHPCIIHGCDYTTNRRWNLFTHLQRRHQYPTNLIESMKKADANRKKRERMQVQQNYDFNCDHCDLAYPNKKRLNEHIKRKHSEHFEGGGSAQVVCAAPGCAQSFQTRERLAEHAAQVHASQNCHYRIEEQIFPHEDDFQAWKLEIEKTTQSDFSINSTSSYSPSSKRVYMWCSKANKARTNIKPDSERKRFGNYGGRTKRVQSHCTAFITAWYLPSGHVQVKFCRDHIGHNQPGMESKRSAEARGRRKQRNVGDESEDDDSYVDVAGEGIDHEEYVEHEGEFEHRMQYSDEEEDEKKPVIRFLTATDRMRPQLNPSYAIEEEYEEEEDHTPSQPSTSLRYMPPPPLQPQDRPRLAYPRPVRPHMRNSEIKNDADLTLELLRESQQRVMQVVQTKKEQKKIERFNHQLQAALKELDPPMIRRSRRTSIRNQAVGGVKLEPKEERFEMDSEDVVQEEEVVEEEIVYEEEASTSYDMHDYYESITSHE